MVEARRRATGRERTAEQEQGKKVRFSEEEQTVEMRAQSTDDQDVMDGFEEGRTGRGSAGLVRGEEDRCQTDETNRRGQGNGSEGEHGKKGIGCKKSSAEHEVDN